METAERSRHQAGRPLRDPVRDPLGAAATVNLLAVDDEARVRELLCAALRHSGFTFAAAASGQEALVGAPQTAPNPDLSDCGTPPML